VDRATARQIAEAFLDRNVRSMLGEQGNEVVIVEHGIRESPGHWGFPYNLRGFVDGTSDDGLIGNGPVVVRKRDQAAWLGGTRRSIDEQLAAYDANSDGLPL
jgi:hypothetical protein